MKPPASAIEILKKAVLLRNDIVHGRANTLTRETAASIVIAVRDLLYFLDAAQGREWALSHLSAEARNDFPQITSWPLLLTPPFRDSFDTTITRILSRGRAHCECLSRVPMGGRGREAKGEWTPAHESAQVDESEAGSWIHAYLHRKEGDQGNAAYWYRRAGKPVCRESLQTEWISLAAELLE